MQNIIPPNDTFIAMFTHDLKTPINSEIFALELLLNDKKNHFNNYQKEILVDVLNATKYLKRLTENALCKFKEDNGNFEIYKEKCEFKSLVLNCIKETKYILNEKNQTLNFRCTNKEIFTNVDIVEMSRVITNLISNASKYSQKNTEINICLKKIKNNISFTIQDHGCGIELRELHKAFDKYVRLLNDQKSAGTGLGLYITKLIIDKHDGKVTINSKIGKGTKVNFTIPL